MAFGVDHDLSIDQSRTVAAAIREELARRRISRQRLADDAKISISTLEKALSGSRPFTLATTIRLEEALGLPLRSGAQPAAIVLPAPASSGFAPDSLGSYAHPAVAWLEGDYLTLRPSFAAPGVVFAYRTEIRWDEAASCLQFREAARLDADFTQRGSVSLPNQSGCVYLVTNEHGQVRLAILGRPTITGDLHGLLTTLHAGNGAQLTPTATPIVLSPLDRWSKIEFGQIGPDHDLFADYRALLDRTTEKGFVRMLPE